MNRKIGTLVVALALATGACANKIIMNRSSSVPAAEARLKVDREGQNMREVELKVRHLAPPERVSPQASHYVVWLQPTIPQADPANLGVLGVGSDQEGELQATTPYKSFQIFVTAEQDAQSTVPSGERVLWATVE